MSEEEQEQRHIYKKILEYEQDAVSRHARADAVVWFRPWRSHPQTECTGGVRQECLVPFSWSDRNLSFCCCALACNADMVAMLWVVPRIFVMSRVAETALGTGSLEALFDVELWLLTCPCMAVNLSMYGC